jgi:hypothetical protein
MLHSYGCIAAAILMSALHTIQMSGQLHAAAALPPGKEPLIQIEEEARQAPEPAWMLWEREKSLVPTGNRNPVVAIPTQLSQLHKVTCCNNIN